MTSPKTSFAPRGNAYVSPSTVWAQIARSYIVFIALGSFASQESRAGYRSAIQIDPEETQVVLAPRCSDLAVTGERSPAFTSPVVRHARSMGQSGAEAAPLPPFASRLDRGSSRR